MTSVWMSQSTLWAAGLVLALLAVRFRTWIKAGGKSLGRRKPAEFSFGADPRMACACSQCKQRGAVLRTGVPATPTSATGSTAFDTPVSSGGRRRRRVRGVKESPATPMRPTKRVAVIGAGAAGASAARQLAERGHSVVVFEALSDVGGRTFTLTNSGYHQFDSGAGFFTNFYPLLMHLVRSLGMSDQVLKLKRVNELVEHGSGRHYKLKLGSIGSLLRMPFVSLWHKLRFLLYTAYMFTRTLKYDVVDPAVLARDDVRSVEVDGIAAVGRAAYNALIRPAIEGFWYYDCAETSCALSRALTAKAATARFYALRHGMDSLTRRLLHHPNIIVRLNAPVQRITSKFQVVYGLPGAEGQDVFQAIVVATTADRAMKIVAQSSELGELVTPFQREYLASQRYSSSVHGCYTVPSGTLGRSSATSLLTVGSGDWETVCVGKTKSKVPRRAFRSGKEGMQVYLSHAVSSALLQKYPPESSEDFEVAPGSAHSTPEQGLAQQVWGYAQSMVPSLPPYSPASCTSIFARRCALPVPEVGRYKLATKFDAQQNGRLVFAGDYLATGTVEGALRSGMRAATLIDAAC